MNTETEKLLDKEFWKTATAKDVKDAIAAGSDIHARNEAGATPLHFAAKFSKNVEAIAVLMQNGADVNARTSDGHKSLLATAAASETSEVTKTLLEDGANSEIPSCILRQNKARH